MSDPGGLKSLGKDLELCPVSEDLARGILVTVH